MTIRLSSGLRDAVISNFGLGAMLYGGHIQVYSGPQPSSPDLPHPGTLLARITQDGAAVPGAGGLLLQLGTYPGELRNNGPWVLKGIASGTPGSWRFVGAPADAGQLSATLARLDGAVGESVQDMPPFITPATNLTLAGFLLTLPNT